MTKEEVISELESKGLDDILKLIKEAEKGKLAELELMEQIGLLQDPTLNEEVLNLLRNLDVEIVYVTHDEEEEEDEETDEK